MDTPIEARKAVKSERLSDTQRYVLRLARDGKSLIADCSGRSEHGGRQATIYSLRRKGLLIKDVISTAGLAALGNS